MSQHWHGHWMEDTFAPKRLRNWEIPKRYPSWPNKHCVTTKFVTDDNGTILDCTKKKPSIRCGEHTRARGTCQEELPPSIIEELSPTNFQQTNEASRVYKRKHLNLGEKVKQAEEPREDIGSSKLTVKKIHPTNQIQESKHQSPKSRTEFK